MSRRLRRIQELALRAPRPNPNRPIPDTVQAVPGQ